MLCVECLQELPYRAWFCPGCSRIQPLLPGAASSSDSPGIEPVRLVTKRLLLRPFQEGDAIDVSEYTVDPRWSGRRLKSQPQSELNFTAVMLCRGDQPKILIGYVRVGICELCMIERIEKFSTELQGG